MCGEYKNIYIVTQDLVYNSILSLHLGRGVVSSVRMVSLVRIVSLIRINRLIYVLGSELWESKFDGLLALVKEYIVDVWEIRKHKLYDSDSGSGLQLHTQSLPRERSGKFSQNGKFGQNSKFDQNKSSYIVLGSELWESKFDRLLALVNEYIVDVWKIRKHKL